MHRHPEMKEKSADCPSGICKFVKMYAMRYQNMSYSIGDVSEALNLSREMIRYYEKCGVLKLSRDTGNNYRSYEIMDVFWLLESLQYRGWGVGIREIQSLRSEDFHIRTPELLNSYISTLDHEIDQKKLLKGRLSELSMKLKQSFYNLDNIWVQYIPSFYSFHLINGNGDSYEKLEVEKNIRDIYFTPDVMGFLDSGVRWNTEIQEWVMQIDERYVRELGLPVMEGMEYVKGGLYVCTNADIGEIGEFRGNAADELLAYVNKKEYKCDGVLRGVLIGRGSVNDSFRRIVEFRMKIEE